MENLYERRVIAFLDILGFARLVEQADKPEAREFILNAVIAMRETLAPNKATDFRTTQFSDCIVLSALPTEYGCNLVMTGAIMLANNLFYRTMLLRGGIAVGNMIHTDDVLFGPGFLAAYRKDASGGTPKIAIDRSLVDEIASWSNDFGLESLIRRDPYDLTPMLHTLYEYEHYTGEKREGQPVLDKNATWLAEKLAWECHGATHPPTVRAKWVWMARYWNEAVAVNGLLDPTDKFVDEIKARNTEIR